jgi:threonine aldolase
MDGEAAKITPDALTDAIARNARGVHSVKPAAVSISQLTERGAAYKPDEVAALGEVARKAGLAFHVDGSRFANAIAALNCEPADLTWRGGVDLLSFGATKNGEPLSASTPPARKILRAGASAAVTSLARAVIRRRNCWPMSRTACG